MKKILTINFDNCTIEEAMSQLKNEGISFILKSDSIDMGAKVDARFTDAPLETIVQTIFQNQNVAFIVKDSVVVGFHGLLCVISFIIRTIHED